MIARPAVSLASGSLRLCASCRLVPNLLPFTTHAALRSPHASILQKPKLLSTVSGDSKTDVLESQTNDAQVDEPASSNPSPEPWYLQVEPPTQPITHEVAPLPTLPESPPPILEPLVKYGYEQMGLDDITILDLREFDPPPPLGENLIMVFGTARSERHLHVSAGRLVRWLRYNHKIEPNADGLIGQSQMRTKLKRLRRRSKLLGGTSALGRGGDDGISTGWVSVSLDNIRDDATEVSRFDASGNLSGFGASSFDDVSTIVFQVMTESRRTELDLETLWRRSLERNKREKEEGPETVTDAVRKLPNFAKQEKKWAKKSPTSHQRRVFSTCVQPRYALFTPSSHANAMVSPRNFSTGLSLEQDAGTEAEIISIVRSVFSGAYAELSPRDQLILMDEFVEAMSKRGVNVLSNEAIIAIIEVIAQTDNPAPQLQRAQKNLESLLTLAKLPCPTEPQLQRLMTAYVVQKNWDRFWDTWRVPPRFLVSRSKDLYQFVFRIAAHTGDENFCMRTLRTCVPSLFLETEPIVLNEEMHNAILACIEVVDPEALNLGGMPVEKLLFRPKGLDVDTPRKAERVEELLEREHNREFVRLVRDLEGVRARRKGIADT